MNLYGCDHPAGCQMPGEGCIGPCPVSPEEGARIQAEMDATPALSPDELARWHAHPAAPESIRERLAAEFAAIDQEALHGEPLDWETTQQMMPDGGLFYRRFADAALRIMTESALR